MLGGMELGLNLANGVLYYSYMYFFYIYPYWRCLNGITLGINKVHKLYMMSLYMARSMLGSRLTNYL